MWAWLGYPPTPPMPRGLLIGLAKLSVGKAEAQSVFDSIFHMWADGLRTEGAMVASAFWLGLILIALMVRAFKTGR